ncbi:MAG: response regulator [Polyangiales bacterium]
MAEQHDVERINDAREALARLREGPMPDAVLCDVMMPDMTGIELYEAVCAHDPALAERFVFLTAGATSEDARRFLADPDRRVIYKPIFDVARLRALIARVVERAWAE